MLVPVAFPQVADSTVWWGDIYPKTITLPRNYQAVLGVTFDGMPRLTYPKWQEYIAGGGGGLTAGGGMQKIIDAGDGFVTWADPTTSFYPRFEISDAQDVGKTVTFTGVDVFGSAVHDSTGNTGFTVTLASPGVTFSTQRIARITSIRKALTEGPVNLFAVDPDNGSLKSQLAIYAPTETVPSYKRYKLVSTDSVQTVGCLCKRRFVPLVNGPDDNVVVIPDNEGALKMMLMALQYEDKNDLERAESYSQKALQLLNSELKEDTGAPIVTLQMNPVAAAMRIPSMY